MREIKFRGWDFMNEKILPVENINFRSAYISLNEGDSSASDTFEMIEIMQYTGLKDVNGIEIYEGDYVGVEMTQDDFNYPMCVTWNEDKHNWSLCIAGCYEYDLTEFEGSYTVIGNVYEGVTYYEINNF